MSVLNKLASALDRSDEIPNQILAREIAAAGNKDAVQELVANLSNPDKNIQHDCIKVLYEAGYLKPDLIAPYVATFVQLLRSRNNRLVWGGMTALGTIAHSTAGDIWKQIDVIMDVTDRGSVDYAGLGYPGIGNGFCPGPNLREANIPLPECLFAEVPR
jgi:hypothetical protein